MFHPSTQNIALFVVSLLIFTSAALQSLGTGVFYIATNAILFLFFIWAAPDTIGKKSVPICFVIIFLFLYSLLFSGFTSRSLTYSIGVFASYLFFLTLSHFNSDKKDDVIKITCFALGLVIFLHALLAITQYLPSPTRTTGFFEDYGQAALAILLGFGLLYPYLKDKIWTLLLITIIFIAFFSTASRTANALLGIFLIAVMFCEFKTRGSCKRAVLYSCSILLALIAIYSYPIVMGYEAIDRGGLSHFSTLNSRVYYWQAAWNGILETPLIGHGLGTYEFTGIKLLKPFSAIYSVHNDYLQIWHDLGIMWLTAFVFCVAFVLIKFFPTAIFKSRPVSKASQLKVFQQALDWGLLCIIALYMTINFIIYSAFFQLIIALLLTRLIANDNQS